VVALSNGVKAMRCTKAASRNAADSRFCNKCATPLSPGVPKCARLNALDAKFCAELRRKR